MEKKCRRKFRLATEKGTKYKALTIKMEKNQYTSTLKGAGISQAWPNP
jgi:hypothetical protein